MMKEYEKLEMSWHIDLCLNVIIKLTGKSRPFISPYPLGLSHRYRHCCIFIASTFWGKQGKGMHRLLLLFYDKLFRHCLGCGRLKEEEEGSFLLSLSESCCWRHVPSHSSRTN